MRLSQVFINNETVVDAAKRRISFIFDNFEDIKVSISGGKDSTVLAHLMLEEAARRQRKIGMFFLDEEVMYQSSIDQVTYMIEDMNPEWVNPLWLQVEFNLTNSTSVDERHLVAWEAGRHEVWMRSKKSYAIKFPPWDTKTQKIENKQIGLGFYAVIENFENCYEGAAFVVGLRGAEAPNRWRAVSKNPIIVNEEPVYWGTQKGKNVSLYPLYDWNFSDIWRYIHENKLRYSKIYDYQFRKGMSINEMRVSSLIHERSFKSIVELPEFEPKTYNKLQKRIKGIAFAQETGKRGKMFKVSKLPKNFDSWIKYRDFLLKTHSNEGQADIFSKRFAKHLQNEYVARQQCRQLILNDTENNVPVVNRPDPREELIAYYMENL
jgi:predicted phosphoadenosine phosphosulfate sulfurtransferase